MQCAEFEILTHEMLDRRLPWDQEPALAKHAQSCAVCRRLANSMQRAIVGLAESPVPQVSSHLATRVVAEVSREADVYPALPRQRVGARTSFAFPLSMWPQAAVFVVAAALLLMVAAPWNWFPNRPANGPAIPAVAQRPSRDATVIVGPNLERPTARLPATEVPAHALLQPMAPLPPISDLARSAGTQYQSLAQHTGESLAVAWLIVPNVPETSGLADRAISGPPSAGATGVWLEDVTEGLKPVTQSTAGSLHSFMQLLPSAPPKDKRS